jgi:hypothetical protein
MTQHDYNLANQTPASFRTDINNALAAIQSVNSSTTAPTATTPGMPWYDTGNDVVKRRNSADSGWITEPYTNRASVLEIYDDFLGVAGVDLLPGDTAWEYDNNGAGSAVTGAASHITDGHPGVVALETGTSTNGYASNFKSRYGTFILGGGELTLEAVIKLSAVSNSTNEYEAYVGMMDQVVVFGLPTYGGTVSDGVYFQYKRATDGDFWSIVTVKSIGSQTKTVTATAVSTNWVKLKYVVNAAATSVEFFINGTSVGTSTQNIPTSASSGSGVVTPAFGIAKTAGTTERIMYADLFSVRQLLTTSR